MDVHYKQSGKKLTQEEVIKRFKKVHGDKYDYSKVNYINSGTKVEIICPKHGSFFQLPFEHWKGSNCPNCNKYRIKTNDEIIKEFKKIHNNFYDYSKVQYKKAIQKVIIICPEHGEFLQTTISHKNGSGCPKCAISKSILNTKEVIERFKKVHGDKYDYSKVNYINSITKVEIICPEHGSFFQKPNTHLNGSGCPKCLESKGERKIRIFLEENNLNYIQEYRIKNCYYKKELPFDFYLPDLNIAVEYDGEQHFKPIKYFGGKKGLNKIKFRDKLKNNFCIKNNVKLIRIPYYKYDSIYNILNNLKEKYEK